MKLNIALSILISSVAVNGQTPSACTPGESFTVEGPCSYASLATGCDLAAAGITEKAVNAACDEAAYPFQEISDLHYQFDNEFFDGGSGWNDDPTSDMTLNQHDRIKRFDARLNMMPKRISRPIYDALGPYYIDELANGDEESAQPSFVDNFNMYEACSENTIMCCYTGNAKEQFIPNSKICTHDMHDTKQSSHVTHGWGQFEDGKDAYCLGYTWKDNDNGASESLVGTALYDISFKHAAMQGYYGSVSGAPMCGCLDRMPVVTNAACRKVDVDGETQTFTINAEGAIEVTNSAVTNITVADCSSSSLQEETQYDVSEHILGTGASCSTDAKPKMLNEKFWVPGTLSDYPKSMKHEYNRFDYHNQSEWTEVAGKGTQLYPIDTTRLDELDAEFRSNTNDHGKQWIFVRHCPSCLKTHKWMYYRRYTAWPSTKEVDDGNGGTTTKEVNSIDYFLNYWRNEFNTIGVDYDLFSTLQEALDANEGPGTGEGRWTNNCKKQQSTVGFPHDCAKNHAERANCQWNSYNRGHICDHNRYNAYDHVFLLPVNKPDLPDFVTETARRELLKKNQQAEEGDEEDTTAE